MGKRWQAKVWKRKKNSKWHGAMAGYVDPGEFAEDIFPNGDYASLFVYMFRRFGVPETGCDPYKEITKWYLTTPDPAVALIVSPSPSGLRLSFGYLINTAIYNYRYDDNETKSKVESALKEAMKDLLIPTNIRDVFINALGIVDDHKLKKTYEYFKWAGYGVSSDYYSKFKNDNQK